jgi:hypothetical protein
MKKKEILHFIDIVDLPDNLTNDQRKTLKILAEKLLTKEIDNEIIKDLRKMNDYN